MKKALFFLLVILMLFGCNQKKDDTQNTKPLIVTTIYPYELLIKQMVGDAIEVKSLIPPNASPHTWSAGPADLKDLNSATLVISNGMGLESFLAQSLGNIKDKHIVVADLLHDLVALDSLNQHKDQLMQAHAEEEHHDEMEAEEHHQHIGADPHLWTSAKMLHTLTTKLKGDLANRFPDIAPLIRTNTDIILKELSAADEKIKAERKGFVEPAIVTYHNSFHYFTTDYAIEYLGWVQSSPGKEPTAKELSALGKKIKEHKIKSIFVEPQQNPKSAEILAKEYKLQIKTLDPLGTSLPVKTISELILANWETMKSGF